MSFLLNSYSFGGGGIATNAVFELDAGLSSSYDGSSQYWRNLVASPADSSSQATYDMFLGTGATVDGYEPTFNGVANADSTAEYFSSASSGDYFSAQSNTTFLNSLHKNDAIFSIYAFVYFGGDSGDFQFISNNGERGVLFFWDSPSKKLYLYVYNDGVTSILSAISSFTLDKSFSGLVGLSFNETTGDLYFYAKDSSGNIQSQTITGQNYNSPSSSNRTAKYLLSYLGSNGKKIWRMGMANVAYTQSNFDDIWATYHSRKLA